MRIEELLAKHVLGVLDDEERRALQEWLDADEAHAAYFRKLSARRNYRERYQAYRAAHSPHPLLAARRWNWRRMAARAAVWMLPVVLALGLWWAFHAPVPPDEILPGSPKATLYLENGAMVELGNSIELGWIRISDNLMAADENGRLLYKESKKARPNLQNTLVTPRGGEYRITLPDGTNVHLNALSKLTYQIPFDGKTREVTLSGEAYFEVAKGSERPFCVKVGGLTVKQFGTKFSINARLPQNTTVALEEGSIGVIPSKGAMQMVEPGQVAVWDETAQTVSVSDANVDTYTAWHRNHFVFEDETLGKIMETFSLWYNIDVRFQDVGIADLHFTGNLSRYENINVILKGIESVVNVQCQVKGRQIRIMRRQ